MGLTFAIADTHGRFDLLCKAVSLCEDYSRGGGTLIVLGDFVDRGPQSRSIIDLLMAGPTLPNWRWIVLQGNHEAMMLECLTNPGILKWWIGNGGNATLKSYGYQHGDDLLPLKIPTNHLMWLAELPVFHEDDHRIYVHAGVPFDQDVRETKTDTLQWMLYAGYDPMGESATIMPDERHVSGKHIVHGHEQSATHPLIKPHRTNLDSFAWYTGQLAIGVFDEEQPGGPINVLFAEGLAA
jgi:serine/threonine protein phosphatase 1